MARLSDIALVEFIRNTRDREGLSWSELEAALKKMGHTSKRFNKPIGISDIRRIYTFGNSAYNRSQEAKGRVVDKPTEISDSEMRGFVKQILHSAALDDKAKVSCLKEYFRGQQKSD